MVKSMGFGARKAEVGVLALSLSSCVTSDKLTNPSMPEIPQKQFGRGGEIMS